MKKLLLFPFVLLAYVLGRISWSPPPWLSSLGLLIQCYRRGFATLVLLAIFASGGFYYHDSLPKPVMVKATAAPISLTPNYRDARPDSLQLQFDYDYAVLNDDQPRPEGYPSVARIDLVGETVVEGVSLSPPREGKWTWRDDRVLEFEPTSDWAAGVDYQVKFDSVIFSESSRLSDHTVRFSTPQFKASVDSIEMYQDPLDISVRRVISTVSFTHPVDKESFESRISMQMRPADAGISVKPKAYRYEVTYDETSRQAYIQSEPLRLPENSSYMTLVVTDGVSSLLGGQASSESMENQTLVPDIFSFLKVASIRTHIIRSEANDPEQILSLEFTDDIAQNELLEKLSLYLLPTKGESHGKRRWGSPREVKPDVLNSSQKVTFKLIPNERNYSKIYNLSLDLPEARYLYLKLDKGLTSVNKFVHRSFYDQVVDTPRYPQEVQIAGEGSILSYSGEQQLSVSTRGLSAVSLVVGKMIKGQINHLVTQTEGDMTNPRFTNWNFNPENITEIDQLVIHLKKTHPAKANYFSIDLNQYLPRDEARFGLFFVDVIAWDKKSNRPIRNIQDRRLIMVTDLGVIVKNNADQSHHLFVQSIATGEPVKSADVELLGKNGIPIFSATTDDRGHLALPSTRGFQREKQPTVYIVKAKGDMSFMPYNRSSRQINLSRFDIGGVHKNQSSRDSLNAYLFSDRGIYRPGETVNLGMIVKNFDMSNVEGIPLEVVIRGPRNSEVLVRKVTLPEKGFFDFQFATELSTITGIYSANLHLVRNNKARGRQLASIRFDVEEFQPDTMKIRSELLDVTMKGWNTQDKLQAKATLTNLFGIPAQDRKMSARVLIEPHSFRFKKYEDYRFTDPHLKSDREPLRLNQQLPDQRTDADGEARFEIDLDAFREGTYRLQFFSEGFDQSGGRSVRSSNSALLSPLETLVGYQADGKLDYINADSERQLEFIAIDKTLNRKSASDLNLKLIEIQQVSTLIKQSNNTYKYQTVKKEVNLSIEKMVIDEAGFQYAINTATPGDFALEVVDPQGLRLARLTYSVVGFANLAGKIDKSAELQLKLDKQDYFPGEQIEMNIRAPYSGAGLITIETDKVHHFKWFKSDTESTVQTIRIPENLEGTGYINVAFVRDAGSKEIFTSPLSYAVKPFSIDKSKRRVDIDLETAEIVRPGKPMRIGFRSSKPSRIAIFAIDEGILQVAGYQTPQPLDHFLKKRALDVGTLQILDMILPEFDLVRSLSAAGGGMALRASEMLAQNLNPFVRKTDKPAVFWAGIYDADSDQREVYFTVPNTFAGELRVMAVAVSDSAVGAASTSAIARGPFVISPSMLTAAAPGDEFEVSVGIANIIEGSGEKVPVELTISSSDHIEILGATTQQLEIDEGSEGRYRFRARAKQQLGSAEIRFEVRHENDDATRSASLSIRPATNHETVLQSGYSDRNQFTLDLQRQLLPQLSQQSITASASPLAIIEGLTTYLDNFPHGCTEQVVSKVFPLVGLSTHPAFGAHQPKMKLYFGHLIDKLRERQLADGGFAFWPGHQSSAAYPSVYVMHFLLESSQRGITVPADMMQRGKDYLVSVSAQPASSIAAARIRANAIYLLTRMGEVTTNYLVDLEESLQRNHKKAWEKDLLAAYMAATYQLLQKDGEAERLIKEYELQSSSHTSAGDFHSLLAVDAQYIFLLSKHFKERAADLGSEAIHNLTQPIFEGHYNTISAAYVILALGAYSEQVMSNQTDENIIFKAIDAAGKELQLAASLQPFLTANYDVDARKLTVSGEKSMYYLNLQAGYDAQPPQQPLSQGIEIYRDFVDDDGNVVTRFEQGKELTARIKVRALSGDRLNNIAIVDLLPGGFEVLRRSVSATARGWKADYVDIREDRVVYYGSFNDQVRELSYRVKLTSAGDFIDPPSYAESMYDRSIRAYTAAGRFEVIASE